MLFVTPEAALVYNMPFIPSQPFDPSVEVPLDMPPFPDLRSVRPRKGFQLKMRSKGRLCDVPKKKNTSSIVKESSSVSPLLSATSAPIPLPKSHPTLTRTWSEIELAAEVDRAEHHDAQMYARLVVGMRSQIQRGGHVHPLSRKSLQGIIRTKMADDQELENQELLNDYIEDSDDDGDGWSMSHTSIDGLSSRSSSPLSSLASQGSKDSLSSMIRASNETEDDDETEDDCIFNLEL